MRRRVWGWALVLLLAVGMLPAQAQESITLVVWDNFTRDAEQAMIEELHAQFEAANPGVKIQRESYDTSDLTALLPRALSEPNGPDVAMINQGFSSMGALVKAGLLLPLNAYADQYGWWERYGQSLHERNSFSADGTVFAGENLYGVSNTAEVVGVYYHKALFEELGLSVPTTWDEFEALVKTIIEAGRTPIVFGSLDGWPAIHTYGAIEHAFSQPEEIDRFIYRSEGGTFNTPGNLIAAQKFVEWIDAGAFSPGFEGMDYDNATLSAFLNQEGVMWITGSWMTGTLIEQLGGEDAVGFFLVPSAVGLETPYAIGGVGLGYGIRATSQHADLAAAYIDLMTGPDAAAKLFENGFLPAVAVDASLLTEGTLTAEVVEAWNTISAGDTVGHYLDWTMPDIAADIQELMAKVVTPEQFIANVETDYTAGR